MEKNKDNASMKVFHADEMILQEGRIYNEMYKIVSGSAVVYVRYGEKDEHLLGIYSKNRCFGEVNIFTSQPCMYTVVAYDEVLLMRITKDSLEDFIKNNPRNAIDMIRNLVQTYGLMQKNIDLLLDDIYEKQDKNQKQTADLKQKIMQYSMCGLNIKMPL